MIESEAYPCGRSYSQRVLAEYKPGDLVTVGPAYRMGGSYAADGTASGPYVIVSRLGASADYKLAWPGREDSWDVIVHASRLTLDSRRYHVVAINERSKRVTVLSREPMSHREACTFKSKFRQRKHARIQLQEVNTDG